MCYSHLKREVKLAENSVGVGKGFLDVYVAFRFLAKLAILGTTNGGVWVLI